MLSDAIYPTLTVVLPIFLSMLLAGEMEDLSGRDKVLLSALVAVLCLVLEPESHRPLTALLGKVHGGG